MLGVVVKTSHNNKNKYHTNKETLWGKIGEGEWVRTIPKIGLCWFPSVFSGLFPALNLVGGTQV